MDQNSRKTPWTLPVAAVATALLLAGCGGGGSSTVSGGPTSPTPVPAPMVVGKVFPTGTTVMLPAGLLDDGSYPASPASEGQSVTVEGVGTFKCNSGPCSVVIANDVITSTGVIEVVSLASDLDPAIVTALADKAEPKPDPAIAQRTTVNTAVDAAMMAVNALTINSTDVEVAAAEALVVMAETAIADGTLLTTAEVATLEGKIAIAKVNLGTANELIAIRKSGETAAKVARLYGDANEAESDAEAAGKAATDALADAMKYSGMLGTQKVGGESAMAEENAQKVLDAQQAAKAAVTNAETAKTAAETAKTAAKALSEDDPNRAGLIAALDAAIEEAEVQLAAAKVVRDGNALKGYVTKVIGTDLENPKTAADVGETVAEFIQTALKAASTTSLTTPDSALKPVVKSDAKGMTWEQIVVAGGKTLITERLDKNKPTKVASVAGMKADDVEGTSEKLLDNESEDGDIVIRDTASYMGIPGTLYCLGGDCMVKDGKLTGSWYFAQDTMNSTNTYVLMTGAGATEYKMESLYAKYGYWLSGATDGALKVNTFANSGSDKVGSFAAADPNKSDAGLKASTATYKGAAAGMSVHKTFDANAKQTGIASGAFTATVELTAKFADNDSLLGGTIDDFRGGAVDPSWSVTLTDSKVMSGKVTGGSVSGAESGKKWQAEAYGEAGKRPTGIFGGFDAAFTDGSAAGAFATRKE